MNVIENKLLEMNQYLCENQINGSIISNGEQLVLMFSENTTFKEYNDFCNVFGLNGSIEFEKHDSTYYIYFDELGDFGKDIFQIEVTQKDCKGEGIKIYRKNDKTFPAKSHPNTYICVCENKRQVNEIMDTYLTYLINGKHEDIVFAVMKHEKAPLIKERFV